ncbi:MAG: DUF2142 domain-containing protein [Clostridiaceae bacterium]|nr:DUF2142 domain-containing protein [Clostridiaceae bacterium]
MKRRYKLMFVLLAAIIFGLVLEIGYYNFRAIKYREDSEVSLLDHSSDFELSGFVRSDNRYISTDPNASITIRVPNQYYNKVYINYVATQDLGADFKAYTPDGDGRVRELSFSDFIDSRLDESVTRIDTFLQEGSITFSNQGNEIELINVTFSRAFQFNVFRFAFFVCAFLVAGVLFVLREFFADKPEWSFVFVAMVAGLVMLVMMPIRHPVVWDDDYHFSRSYAIASGNDVEWTEATHIYSNRAAPNFNTLEEYNYAADYMNERDDLDQIIVNDPGSLYIVPRFRSYLPIAASLFLGRVLKVDFFTLQAMGRAGNLLFYVLVVFFAIRIIPSGKRIIAVLALLPTPMFMAVNYNYDPFIISMMLLGFALFFREHSRKDSTISTRSMLAMVSAFVFASFSKAIYIPVILILFLLGEKKFASRKQMVFFRICIFGIFLLMMATFVIPATDSSLKGDFRGGDTDVSRQLAHIMAGPVAYARLLLHNIWISIGEYTLGIQPLVNFAHMGFDRGNTYYACIALLIYVCITDTANSELTRYSVKEKLYVCALVFASVSLIWTALYLSFTPVGVDYIAGVQPRYYIPLLLPMMFIFRSSEIKNKINPSKYGVGVSLFSTFIIFNTIYYMFLKVLLF